MVDYARYGFEFERSFQKGLAKRRREHGDLFYFKIPDARTLGTSEKGGGIKVPADFFLLVSGTPILVECKSTNAKRFKMAMVKPHQLMYLNEIWSHGGKGYFAIEHRIKRKSKMYIIDARYFVENPAKSYTWEEIAKDSIMIIKKKYGMYDMGVEAWQEKPVSKKSQ